MIKENQGNSTGILRLFANPYISIIGSIASIIGVFVAVYFYYASKQYRELVYFIHPAKAIIAKTGQISNLILFYENKQIKGDVTAVQVAIWNRGDAPIKNENILSQLKVITTPKVNILEASILKMSRDIVKIDFDKSLLHEGIISLTWNILEKDDGIIIQLIYEGDTNVNIFMEGTIEGQFAPKEIRYHGSILSPLEQFSNEKRDSKIFLLIFLFFLIIFTIFGRKLVFTRKIITAPINTICIFVYFSTLFLIITIFVIWYLIPEPPFGF